MKSLSLLNLFLALGCERISTKTFSTESRFVRLRTGKYTICRRLGVLFSPEILQAGAVKGLTLYVLLFALWWAVGFNLEK